MNTPNTTLKKKFEYGYQFGAQIIKNRDLWFVCGGEHSQFFKMTGIEKKLRDIEDIPILLSNYSSFDLISINRNIPKQKKPTVINISDGFSYKENKNTSQRSRRRRGYSNSSNFEFGIHIKLVSDAYNSFYEGFFHYLLIHFLNEINGIEYHSHNHHANLRVSKILKNYCEFEEFMLFLGNTLITQFKEHLPQIQDIKIEFWVGFDSESNERQDIEKILIERRLNFLKKLEKENSIIDRNGKLQKEITYIINTNNPRIFISSIIISPSIGDQNGYLNYTDIHAIYKQINNRNQNAILDLLDIINIEKIEEYIREIQNNTKVISSNDKIKEYRTYHKQLNQFFKRISFGSINEVNLLSFKKPLPLNISNDIFIIQLPFKEGIALMDTTFKETLLSKYAIGPINSEWIDGSQHKGIFGISRFDIKSKLLIKFLDNWNRVCWINKSLFERISYLIPENIRHKIATEEDGLSEDDLKTYLTNKEHPIFLTDDKSQESLILDLQNEIKKMTEAKLQFEKGNLTIILPMNNNNYKITMKNLRITAEELKIQKI